MRSRKNRNLRVNHLEIVDVFLCAQKDEIHKVKTHLSNILMICFTDFKRSLRLKELCKYMTFHSLFKGFLST